MLPLLLNGQEKQACNNKQYYSLVYDQHSTVHGATATTTGAQVVVCKSAGGDGKSVRGGSLEGQGGSLGGSQRRGGSGHKIYGYSDSTPTIDGPERCPHCFCSPCVVALPPAFLVGSVPPNLRNAHKIYPLYRKFWRVCRDIGVWKHREGPKNLSG